MPAGPMSGPEPDTQIVPPRGAEDVPGRSLERDRGRERDRGHNFGQDSEAVRDSGALRRWVGRYELIHRIAHGGMATVYLGRAKGQAGFEKIVAVKIIHPHLASEAEFVGMFLDEARIAARLHHPHVVEILDLGENDGVYYMVMEFIEGENLSALVRALGHERLPVAVTLQIIADTLEGLNAAHELRDADGQPFKLVHRDVSPHNILINLDGWAKVGDFGIMKAAGKASNTKTGELRGKLAYMSPEQARGGAVDHRTDLFAVGVIAWELLTGQRLFACAGEAATLEKVIACKVPPLADHELETGSQRWHPELRAGLQSLIERTLAVDPEQRPSDAAAMLTEVKRLIRLVDELPEPVHGPELADTSDPADTPEREEPRAYLGRMMQRFFLRRVSYARAALRRTGEHDALASNSREWLVEPTLAVGRPPTGSNSVVGRTPTGPLERSAELTGSHPSALAGVGSGLGLGPNPGSASHPQLSMVQPSRLAQWSMWLLLPMLGAGIAIAAMFLFGPDTTSQDPPPAKPAPSSFDKAPSPSSLAATEYQPVAQKQRPPGQVRWYFSTTPRGARVLIDGEVRGDPTPTWVYLPTSEELLDIRIELDGYEPRALQLPAVTDQTFSEPLQPLALDTQATPAKPKPRHRSKVKQPAKPDKGSSRPDAKPGPSTTQFVPVPESLREGGTK